MCVCVCVGGGGGGGGGRVLFPCSPEIFQHFPLFPKIKVLIFYVPCYKKKKKKKKKNTFVPLFPSF